MPWEWQSPMLFRHYAPTTSSPQVRARTRPDRPGCGNVRKQDCDFFIIARVAPQAAIGDEIDLLELLPVTAEALVGQVDAGRGDASAIDRDRAATARQVIAGTSLSAVKAENICSNGALPF